MNAPSPRQRAYAGGTHAHLNACSQQYALGNRVNPEPDRNAGYALGADKLMTVIAVMVQVLRLAGEIVLVKMEHAQQGNHHDRAENRPYHALLGALGTRNAVQPVGQKVIKCNTQDESRHQAHDQLGAGMRKRAQQREFPAQKCRRKDRQAVPEQQ